VVFTTQATIKILDWLIDVWPHHSTPQPTALAESTEWDSAQACCSRVQVSARDSTIVSRRWVRVHGLFRGLETQSICFITVAECPSYTAHLPSVIGPSPIAVASTKQSVPTCHVCTLYVCFPKVASSLKAFLFRRSVTWLFRLSKLSYLYLHTRPTVTVAATKDQY